MSDRILNVKQRAASTFAKSLARASELAATIAANREFRRQIRNEPEVVPFYILKSDEPKLETRPLVIPEDSPRNLMGPVITTKRQVGIIKVKPPEDIRKLNVAPTSDGGTYPKLVLDHDMTVGFFAPPAASNGKSYDLSR